MQVAAVQAPDSVRAFIQEYFDAWKGPDENKILAYYSENVVIHLPTGADLALPLDKFLSCCVLSPPNSL